MIKGSSEPVSMAKCESFEDEHGTYTVRVTGKDRFGNVIDIREGDPEAIREVLRYERKNAAGYGETMGIQNMIVAMRNF